VRAAAAELDYRPNPAAQVLRRGKTRTIGFISDEVTLTRHASGLIGGALEVSKANDHTMLIAETEGIEGGLARAFETMIDHRVDGILIGLLGARLIDLPSTSTGVPVVVLNGASSSGHANVLPDERAAGYAVAKRLVDAGHRRIGVVGDLPREVINDLRQTATVALRFEGIAAAFAEAGIEPVRVDIPEWQRAGRLVPGLTTARLPYQEIGALGASMLLGRHALGHELVTMPIIERDSLATLSPAAPSPDAV
jgi:LacI family transcriptional regulator